MVKVFPGPTDKYGRLLASFEAMKHDGQVVNINNFLVQEEMAKMYEGGKK